MHIEGYQIISIVLTCVWTAVATVKKDLSQRTNTTSVGIDYNGTHYNSADDIQVYCSELRSKKYISDGFCTSIKAVTEVVCAGQCLPLPRLDWYAEFVKVWATYKTKEYRCVDDRYRRKRVQLVCNNGETRTYRIKVVQSCKCKKYHKVHNRPLKTSSRVRGRRRGRNGRKSNRRRNRKGKSKDGKRTRKAKNKRNKSTKPVVKEISDTNKNNKSKQ